VNSDVFRVDAVASSVSNDRDIPAEQARLAVMVCWPVDFGRRPDRDRDQAEASQNNGVVNIRYAVTSTRPRALITMVVTKETCRRPRASVKVRLNVGGNFSVTPGAEEQGVPWRWRVETSGRNCRVWPFME